MPGLLRVLGERDRAAVLGLVARNPVAHCFVAARVESSGLDAWRLGGELWGWFEDDRLVSALYAGANLVPVETTSTARSAFAERAARLGRRCSSIVGPADEVADLWRALEPAWGPAREVRAVQPVMATRTMSSVQPDPAVRRVGLDELDVLLPAAVAMFTEEVGVSPVAGGAGPAYRARMAEIVRDGRAFAHIEDDRVLFKAEVGAVSSACCQVQGVWVDPAYRGRGLSLSGMAAVVALGLREIAPVVSLYVNDYNLPARRSYARVGFHDVGVFTTVLF